MIYDAKADKIPLSREIRNIEDYIELIRLRTSGANYLSYKLNGHPGNLQIAPMLFIPLIENAYKHSSKKEGENVISIYVEIDNFNVSLNVNNEYDSAAISADQSSGGIGLNLVRHRLEIIYPEKNTFIISKDNNRFNVGLKLKLDEY
jgi:LytS/YehU family sensor histidine kinase